MRALANSVLATLFVLVLLMVLPLIAVFGIPEFVPVVASSSTDREAHERALEAVGIGESAGYQPHDLFAGFDQPPAESTDPFDTQKALGAAEEPARSVAPLEGWEFDDAGRVGRNELAADDEFGSVDPFREGETVSLDRQPPTRSEPSGFRRPREAGATGGPLTWGDAVARLKELGIDEYQLTPGRNDQFHFACNYSPRDNPRIVHRFEAEAGEPLSAVRKVLGQIGSWADRHR